MAPKKSKPRREFSRLFRIEKESFPGRFAVKNNVSNLHDRYGRLYYNVNIYTSAARIDAANALSPRHRLPRRVANAFFKRSNPAGSNCYERISNMKTIEQDLALRLVREAERMPSNERKELAAKRLKALVAYAKENSPYLARLYRDCPQDFTLSDLPITQKSDLQENFDEWVTDRAVNSAALRAHLDACAREGSAAPFLSKYAFVSTSGTTGAPFTILRDDYHNKIHGALMSERFLKIVGPDATSPRKNRIASVIMTDPRVSSYGSFLRSKKAAGEFGENMLAVSVVESIPNIVNALNAYQPTVLTGYPSIFTLLAEEQLAGRLQIHTDCIFCSAELLDHATYEKLCAAFQCPVLNNYCMTEGGEVAFANGLCENLHLNDDWIIVEPIDENGNPAKPGALSHAILVSDLSNYICPIIRYKMTDRVMLEPGENCACKSTLPILKIAGRETPVLLLCGRTISSAGLSSTLEKTPEMLKFQIARVREDALELRLCTKDGASFERAKLWMEEHTRELLQRSGFSDVKFSVVKWQPVNDAKSGKFKVVVDEVK